MGKRVGFQRQSVVQHLALIALAAIIPFSTLLAFNIYSQAREEADLAKANVLRLAESTAYDAERFVGTLRTLLEKLSERPSIRALDPEACDPELGAFAKLFPQIANILTVDSEGQMICTANASVAGGRRSIDPVYFLDNAKRTRAFTMGTPGKGLFTGKWVVTLAVPIIDHAGDFRGVIALSIDLVKFSQTRNIKGLPPNAINGVVDLQGITLARSDDPEKWVGHQRADRTSRLTRPIDAEGRIGLGTGPDGVKRIYALHEIPGLDWSAFVGLPFYELYADTNRRAAISTGVALGTAMLVGFLCFVLARRIARPIKAIAEGARQAGVGDLGVRVEPAGPAEVTEVAIEFNNMLAARAAAELEAQEASARLRESESRFRSIFEQAGLGMAMVDVGRGRILEGNPALGRMLGYSEQGLRELDVGDISDPPDNEQDRDLRKEIVEGSGAVRRLEKSYRRKDGSLLWGVLTATLVRADNGQPKFVVAMLEDVTDLKRSQDEARQLAEQLLSAQEAERASLSRELHDEFGQMLTALKLQLQALALRVPSPQLEDSIALVDQLLRQVRELSLDLRPAKLDDFGLAAALASHLNLLSRRAQIPIRFESAPDVPLLTGVRATACFRIVQEAVTNALRHSGGRSIEVTLLRDADDLYMEIRDDGIGYDLEQARADAVQGSSVGILGIQDRAEGLGGALEIVTAPGSGTLIRVRIPLESLRSMAG